MPTQDRAQSLYIDWMEEFAPGRPSDMGGSLLQPRGRSGDPGFRNASSKNMFSSRCHGESFY